MGIVCNGSTDDMEHDTEYFCILVFIFHTVCYFPHKQDGILKIKETGTSGYRRVPFSKE